MGGGASKDNGEQSPTTSDSKSRKASMSNDSQQGRENTGGQGSGQETPGGPGGSGVGDGGSQSKPPAESFTKLKCTVDDARLNTFVPFVSSVRDSNELGDDGAAMSGTMSNSDEGEETTDSTSESDEGSKFVFGEVAIDLTKANGSGNSAGNSPTRQRKGTPGLDRQPPETAATAIIAAHHSGGSQQDVWKTVEIGRVETGPVEKSKKGSVSNNGTGGIMMGDMKVAADPRSCSVASWFSASTRYAVPRRYSFIPFAAQHGPIRCLSASAEASQVAVVVSGGKQCYVMDLQGNLLMSVKGHLDPVLSCSQSKDGKFLVTTSADCTAVMWDLNNGKKLRELPVSTQVNCVTVSDESDAIATTSTDDVVHLWDSKSCDPLIMFQRHTAGIFSMSFSRRGGMIASGSSNGEIYVWAQSSGEVRNFLAKHRTPVLGVSFSHDSQRLVSVDRETLRVWDLFTGQCIFCRDTKGNLIYGVDEEHGATRQANEENVRYTCCAFVAGQLIATGLTSKQLLLLDPNEGKEVLSLSTKNLVTSLSPSWMGDVLFVGDLSGNIYRLELTFSQSDVLAFHLDSKPPTKEKRGVEKD